MIFERLTAEMAALGIGSFTVSPGVTTEELQRAGAFWERSPSRSLGRAASCTCPRRRSCRTSLPAW